MSNDTQQASRLHVRFTSEEDDTIIAYIRNGNFKNLAEAFDNLSIRLNRKARNIKFRYYNALREKEDMFYMVSKDKVLVNTKYVHREKEAEFKPFQIIVKQILDLPRLERERVLAFFQQ